MGRYNGETTPHHREKEPSVNDFPSPSPPRRLGLVAAALAVAALAGAPLLAPAQVANIIENFKATLQRHPNGRVKTMLTAAHAELPPDGTIHGTDVHVIVCDEEGNLTAELQGETIVVDQEAKTGHCPGAASFERHAPRRRGDTVVENGVSIAGYNVVWSGNDNQLVINSNAVVTIFREGRTLVEGWK